MQGRGVTNFAVDKPSHEFSTRTTEFDDALVARGIVTTNQVMLAKGASPEEASRLAREKTGEGEGFPPDKDRETTQAKSEEMGDQADSESDSASFDYEEDDDFFARYREQRLACIHDANSANVEHIVRGDWSSRVNDASRDRWILITLLDVSLGSRRQEILQELSYLAREHCSKVSLLTIEATEAVPNWPSERVPAMFAYRDGVKKHEWITDQNGIFPNRGVMAQLLKKWNVLN